MEALVRDKRDMRPLLFKLGVAVAFSLAGFFVSHLRSRFRSQNPIQGDDGLKSSGKLRNGSGGLKDELRILKNDEALAKIINGTTTTTTTTTTKTTVLGLSPTRKSPREEEEYGFLLPEFNEIMKEFEATGRDSGNDTPTSTFAVNKKFETEKDIAMEQEIARLKNLVVSLSERERCLELQLLEYYGMQEQEAALRELESQLKMNTMETKLYTMKIESLQADNQRLQAQVLDYSRVVSELESSRAKIKLLKRKLKSDGQQAKEKITLMHQIISKFQAKEAKDQANDVEVEMQLKKRLKDLEDEVDSLRMINSRLLVDNSELATKLESTQMLASSLEAPKADVIDDVNHLREVNEKLMNDIDQLKTDRCTDVEQLVYLRWVNACLRYELRNYQPPPGKAAARDLSKNLSPKSEAKAKQLIIEYAKSTGDEKNTGLVDFDSEYSYPLSQVSTGESEDNSFDICSTTTTNCNRASKSKFLIKLKNLVLGRNTQKTPPISNSNSERRMSISSSNDDIIGRDSYNSFSSCMTEEHAPATELILSQNDEQGHNKARLSVDIQGFGKQRLEVKEVKEEQFRSYEGREVEQERMINFCRKSLLENDDKNFPEKAELKRFAEVLRGSHKMSKMIRKRSSSFSHI
ncbi:hypothetical protein J5N97_013420 [Dioscorea zingiberensis]|uniref:Uncharacterized protein n=1 Tax=Dioscorea zingiberensis TaxID=325984 RepID=A0A9D5CQI5_9LILI|nr:hypothetical protein J5N97_013420 [Dioscorea zingiberensis]